MIRRIHLYAGLLLLPWVLLYGISGVLFNHEDVGRGLTLHSVTATELEAMTGITPRSPDDLAQQIVEQLNSQRQDSKPAYRLDTDYAGRFSAHAVLQSTSKDARHTVTLDLARGSAVVSTQTDEPRGPKPPFADTRLTLPDHQMPAVEKQVAGLLSQLSIDGASALRAGNRAPDLRFRLFDDQQRLWNVSWNISTGRLQGRLAEDLPVIPAAEALTRLHKTHGYPPHRGALWARILIGDIMGVTMVVWALSGLVMWWQIKPTRVVGAVALFAAVVIAAMVMSGTLADLLYNGASPPPPPRSAPAAAPQ